MELSITKKTKRKTPDGAVYYEVVMSDDSEWVCDYKGENWKRTVLPKEELTENILLEKFTAGKSPLTIKKK